MCNEKIISDLQSTPTALNLGVLSKSLASDDDQHISECETGTTGTHKLSGSVRSLLRDVREVKHSFFLSGCSPKRRSPRPLVTSKHGTGAGPSEGCFLYPCLKLALFKQTNNNSKQKKESVNQVGNTPNFLLHQSTRCTLREGEGEREPPGIWWWIKTWSERCWVCIQFSSPCSDVVETADFKENVNESS